MAKKVSSIKHKDDKRVHIPSQEEAGYEDANPKVKSGKKTLDLPKNPVVHRGQDPELFWKNKYGEDDQDDRLKVDIRSLYRHEHIAPENLIEGLHKTVIEKSDDDQLDLFNTNELFGNALEKDELDKVSDYYSHKDGWTNRLIQGDSLLVMSSLLEREGMAGQVQCVYIDPPYGIKYKGNWQMRISSTAMKESDTDDQLTGEPEMIRAFRDTWELGIHSYLSYLRERLLVAKELMTDSGSCFVQISDENVHLVRGLMDEVFGSENFIGQIFFQKTGGFSPTYISGIGDYIIWYGKDTKQTKYRGLYEVSEKPPLGDPNYVWLELADGSIRRMSSDEKKQIKDYPKGSKVFRYGPLQSSGKSNTPQDFNHEGTIYSPSRNSHWKTNLDGMKNLADKGFILKSGTGLAFKLYYTPARELVNVWLDTQSGGFNDPKRYVVQTTNKVIQRCLLMTTDPGDLVLDPTCGSGTSAFVAEQWGRRWITIDTSRIALNVAKSRLATATFPYFYLYSDVKVDESIDKGKILKSIKEKPTEELEGDIRQGFVYEEIPKLTLKAIANDEPISRISLFDSPIEDKHKLRVTGPFTVETLQNYEPVSPDEITETATEDEEMQGFEERVFAHLKSAGVKNGVKGEQAVFIRVERLTSSYLNAEGYYQTPEGEKKAYFHIGPKFGTVSKLAVNEAVKECRTRGDADWLVILGFSFQDDIQSNEQSTDLGIFQVTKARMHDDLMQEGLLKKDKKAGSFITIGEPDIEPIKDGASVTLEVKGLDIYDPIKDEVKARNVSDIAYWMVDDDYDGSNFVVKQIFFCGGDKKEFDKWRKGLDDLAKQNTKRKAEKTLKIEIDEEAFDRLYGFQSHPIEIQKKGQKVAVRVVSQFGEESTKVITL
jgi:adenine-specific DNA-methyltransferase